MKVNGKPLSKMNNQIVIIPRSDGDIIFKAAAVLDQTEFEQLCPEPKPPSIMRKGETVASADLNDPKYKEAVAKRNKQYTYFLILKSLQATEGLEWDKVKVNEPETWESLEKDMEESGLTSMERAQILQAVMRANSLDMSYIEEARKRFFALELQKSQPQ